MLAVPGVPPLSPTHQLLPGKGQLSLRATWPCLSPCVCPPSRAQLLWGWEGANGGGRTGGVGGEKFAIFFFLRDFFFDSFKAETRSKGISTSSNRDHLVH